MIILGERESFLILFPCQNIKEHICESFSHLPRT